MTADPVIISVAPNGARKTTSDHPAVPVTAADIADTAAACRDAGASMIHLHIRDADQKHTLDIDGYKDAIVAVKAAVGDDLVIQVTSEAVGIYTCEEQMAMVRAVKPEAVSLAVRELFPNPEMEVEAAAFCAWMAKEQIHPQYILYDASDVARFAELVGRGIIHHDRPACLYVLGRYSKDLTSAPADLLPFLEEAEKAGQTIGQNADGDADASNSWVWSMCAFGHLEAACALSAAAMGGHVRVGFENNLLLSDGSVAPDNAALVAQVVDHVSVMGRTAASADQARHIFGIGG